MYENVEMKVIFAAELEKLMAADERIMVLDADLARANGAPPDVKQEFTLLAIDLLLQAGATILPANPSFYTRPQTVEQVVDTVVARVLDHLGLPHKLVARWKEERE